MEPIDDPIRALRAKLARMKQEQAPAPAGDGAPTSPGFDPQFESGLSGLLAGSPRPVTVHSGFRTREEQQEVYDKAQAGTGPPANRPGTSEHEFGRAADLRLASGQPLASDPETLEYVRQNAQRHGLAFPYEKEPWHVELARRNGVETDPVASGPAVGGTIPAPGAAFRQEETQEAVFGKDPATRLREKLAQMKAGEGPYADPPITPQPIVQPGGDGAPGAWPGLEAGIPPDFNPPGVGDWAQTIGSNIGRAFAMGASGMVKTIPVLAQVIEQALPDQLEALTLRDEQGNVTPAGERFLFQLATDFDEWVADNLPVDPRLQESFWATDVPQALGSMAFFMAGGMAGKALKASRAATIGALGSGVQTSSMYEEAIRLGADPELAGIVAMAGIPIGATELLPIGRMFGRLGGKRKLLAVVLAGAEELTQESIQQLANNNVIRELVDENRDMLEGVARGGAAGGLSGAAAQLAVLLLGGRARGGGRPPVAEQGGDGAAPGVGAPVAPAPVGAPEPGAPGSGDTEQELPTPRRRAPEGPDETAAVQAHISSLSDAEILDILDRSDELAPATVSLLTDEYNGRQLGERSQTKGTRAEPVGALGAVAPAGPAGQEGPVSPPDPGALADRGEATGRPAAQPADELTERKLAPQEQHAIREEIKQREAELRYEESPEIIPDETAVGAAIVVDPGTPQERVYVDQQHWQAAGRAQDAGTIDDGPRSDSPFVSKATGTPVLMDAVLTSTGRVIPYAKSVELFGVGTSEEIAESGGVDRGSAKAQALELDRGFWGEENADLTPEGIARRALAAANGDQDDAGRIAQQYLEKKYQLEPRGILPHRVGTLDEVLGRVEERIRGGTTDAKTKPGEREGAGAAQEGTEAPEAPAAPEGQAAPAGEPGEYQAVGGIVELPVADVNTKPEFFQPEGGERGAKGYAEETAAAIASDAFNRQLLEANPVVVWKDEKGEIGPVGALWMLAGHGRLAGMQRRGEATIPGKILTGMTAQEAQEFARTENARRTMQTLIEDASPLRDMRARGESEAAIVRKSKELYKRNGRTVYALSFLNPGGKALQAVQQMSANETGDREKVQTMAKWIGEVRAAVQTLTDRHENEIYDLLKATFGEKDYAKNQQAFKDYVAKHLDKISVFGQVPESLNFASFIAKSLQEIEIDRQLTEQRKALKDAKDAYAERDRSLAEEGRVISDTERNRVLKPFNEAVAYEQAKLDQMEKEAGVARQQVKRTQMGLFGDLTPLSDQAPTTDEEARADLERAGVEPEVIDAAERATDEAVQRGDDAVASLEAATEGPTVEDVDDAIADLTWTLTGKPPGLLHGQLVYNGRRYDVKVIDNRWNKSVPQGKIHIILTRKGVKLDTQTYDGSADGVTLLAEQRIFARITNAIDAAEQAREVRQKEKTARTSATAADKAAETRKSREQLDEWVDRVVKPIRVAFRAIQESTEPEAEVRRQAKALIARIGEAQAEGQSKKLGAADLAVMHRKLSEFLGRKEEAPAGPAKAPAKAGRFKVGDRVFHGVDPRTKGFPLDPAAVLTVVHVYTSKYGVPMVEVKNAAGNVLAFPAEEYTPYTEQAETPAESPNEGDWDSLLGEFGDDLDPDGPSAVREPETQSYAEYDRETPDSRKRLDGRGLDYIVREGEDRLTSYGLAGRAVRDAERVARQDPGAQGELFAESGPVPVRLRGVGITSRLRADAIVRLIGQEVRSVLDLAVLAQVFRDPRFETNRLIFVRKGKIVGMLGVTSRMPGFSLIYPPEVDEARQAAIGREAKYSVIRNWVESEMRRFGADGFYLVHNHPSGQTNPSNEDRGFTSMMHDVNPGLLKGHVIVNSGEVTILTVERGVLKEERMGLRQLPDSDRAIELAQIDPVTGQDRLLTPEIPHVGLGMEITGPPAVVAVGHTVSHDPWILTLIGTTSQGTTRIIADLDLEWLQDPTIKLEDKYKELQELARNTGTASFFVVGLANAREADAFPALAGMLRRGVIRDLVAHDLSSYGYEVLGMGSRPDVRWPLGIDEDWTDAIVLRDDEAFIREPEGPGYGFNPKLAAAVSGIAFKYGFQGRTFAEFAHDARRKAGPSVIKYIKGAWMQAKDVLEQSNEPAEKAAGVKMDGRDVLDAFDFLALEKQFAPRPLEPEQPGARREVQPSGGESDVRRTDTSLESDRERAGRAPRGVAPSDAPGGPGAGGVAGSSGGPAGGFGLFAGSGFGVPGEPAGATRGAGDRGVSPRAGDVGPDTGGGDRGRGAAAGRDVAGVRIPPEGPGRVPADTQGPEGAGSVQKQRADVDDGKARDRAERLKRQREAGSLQVKPADIDNIRETLPILLPEQQMDVLRAEKRFEADGKGYLFTNGTGTGKTFVGLGIIKRMVMRGKGRILVVVPQGQKAHDWANVEGPRVGVKISVLPDTTSPLPEGVVTTTFANFRLNDRILEEEWDLVIYDEAHKILSNEAGEDTVGLGRHHMTTNHPEAIWRKLLERNPEYRKLTAKRDALMELKRSPQRLTGAQENQLGSIQVRLGELQREANEQAKTFEDKTRVVFLSATPFSYHTSLRYGEGYLFDAPHDPNETGYNTPTGFNRFLVEKLGYRMRYGKVTIPESGVDVGLLERELFEWMVKEGVASTHQLDIPFDYSRDFVAVDGGRIGQLLDEGWRVLGEDKEYRDLLDALQRQKRWQYLNISRILEGLKAREAVKRIRDHIALGRQVVVYHNYNKGGALHPFRLEGGADYEARQQYERFKLAYPDLVALDISGLESVPNTLERALGEDVAIFNGTVPAKQRQRNVKAFQEGKVKVIVAQIEAGKEGISLHDTKGDTPRVVIQLGLPVKPTDAIQSEGRIYRYGNESNAVFEYLTVNLDFERHMFAQKISSRSKTAENLAMGRLARNLEVAFKEGYQDARELAPSLDQGTGSKEADRSHNEATDYDRAKTYFWRRQKRTARTKSAEGTDYYATPEPIGLKMVEWLELIPNEDVIEPSAGHGAIARWLPATTNNTLVEPSFELAAQLGLNVEGEHTKVRREQFEDLDTGANKADAIVMNPPYGTAGKTAMEHLAKAWEHLRDGGRIIAIIPDGPSMQKRFDAWLEGEKSTGAVVSASIGLPAVTFDRAGAGVKTRILVLDKHLTSITGGDVKIGDRVMVIGGTTTGEVVQLVRGIHVGINEDGTGRLRWAKMENVVRLVNGKPDPSKVDNKRAMDAQSRARSPREIQAETVEELFEKMEDMSVPSRIRVEEAKREEAKAQEPADTGKPRATSLGAMGIRVRKTTDPYGKDVWEVTGSGTYENRARIKKLGARWYGPKRAWTFREDPTAKLNKEFGFDGEPNGFDQENNLNCED